MNPSVQGPTDSLSSVEQYGYKQELKRSLSFWDLVVYGLIFMVPIAPMGIYGQVVQTAHGMVVFAYFIGLVGMIFTAYSYARMSEAFPISGSAYAYVQRGWNPYIGFLAGWMILLDYILIPSLLYLVSASWLAELVPGVPTWLWIVVFVAINTIINILGIQLTSRANWIILVFELVTFVLFCVMAFAYVAGGHGHTTFTAAPIYQAHAFSWSMVGAATSIAVLSFLGFDGISTLAEETRGGRRTVGRATVTALIVIAVLFMVLTYLAACAYPDFMHFPDPDVAFYFVAERVGGTWLKVLCLAATVIAWGIANALAAQAAISRLLFSMGRDKALPGFLAKVHPRFQTPYTSTLLVAVVSVIVSVASSIGTLSSLVNFGALTTFLLLNLTVVIYHFIKRRSGRWFAHLVMPLLGFAVLLYVWLNFDRLTLRLGVAWAIVGVIVLAIRTRGFRRAPQPMQLEQ
ncbi:MAG: APC family permease [Alicyclobacillus herbarius]|uniref:APC family permease n=1 Tax=Alicyclobacillus herbarius TaxID=122960 RepID=UPI002353C7B1|nr:APC family permease [Alicyclobacillus herbarius]MCL6633752.1 APC family permease [Alicyclobacillus herbarius]